MTNTTTRDGVDTTIEISPDTPANQDRLQRALSHLDRLASELAAIDPHWVIDLIVGETAPIYVTAEPTTDRQDTEA